MRPIGTAKNEKCESCKYWDDYGDDEDAKPREGACCRFPPIRIVTTEEDEDTRMHHQWKYPITGGHWWCGEWKIIEVKKN